jgi:hypothetical protein
VRETYSRDKRIIRFQENAGELLVVEADGDGPGDKELGHFINMFGQDDGGIMIDLAAGFAEEDLVERILG